MRKVYFITQFAYDICVNLLRVVEGYEMNRKTPDAVAQEILLKAGVNLERMLPGIIRAAGQEYTGHIELNISVDLSSGAVFKVRSGVTMRQA